MWAAVRRAPEHLRASLAFQRLIDNTYLRLSYRIVHAAFAPGFTRSLALPLAVTCITVGSYWPRKDQRSSFPFVC